MEYRFMQQVGTKTWYPQFCNVWTRSFANDAAAAAYARDCANADQKETRWNSVGSEQGHYVFPNAKTKIESEIETDPNFWDCECTENYIHAKWTDHCATCGAKHHDQPDSRVSEIALLLSVVQERK